MQRDQLACISRANLKKTGVEGSHRGLTGHEKPTKLHGKGIAGSTPATVTRIFKKNNRRYMLMRINVTDALAIAKADSIPTPGNREITVEWTGHYPCLCHGEWVITIDGEKVDLPEDVVDSPMNTAGVYRTWHFGEDWAEEWEFYSDVLEFDEWVAQAEWLKSLDLSDTETRELYDLISEQDWRHNSCGGCI